MKRNDYLPPRIKTAATDDALLAFSLPGFGDGGSLNAKKDAMGSVWDDNDDGADEDHDAPGSNFWE